MIILDVSAVIPFLLYKDEKLNYTIEQAQEIIAPELYVPESGNTLLQYVKKELITMEEAYKYINQSLDIVDSFINLANHSTDILSMAYRNNISFYDAQYLFLTKAMNGKLLSRDKALNRVSEKLGLKY